VNLKLIEKLAKLANNNPNDNEANSAARRVCKLLAEGNFKYQDGGTWNDVRRSTEPEFRPKPPSDDIYDFFRNMGFGNAGGGKSAYKNYYDGSWAEPKEPKYKYANKAQEDFYNEPKKESRKRTCSKCGKECWTKRVTSVFTCNECEWNDYQNRGWVYNHMNNTYMCPRCGASHTAISIVNVDFNYNCTCGYAFKHPGGNK